MSWLNNSLNTIKGQLTTLAQEVLAETAGPGDEDYRGDEIIAVDNRTALQLLADTQKEKDDLNKLCNEKEYEITLLRRQISELLSNKICDSGGGIGASERTSKSLTDNNNATTLEDSWHWEPDTTKHENDRSSETSSSGNGNEMVNITLEEVPLGASTRGPKSGQRAASDLQRRVQDLEHENRQLNGALEELDAQHNLAMQNVLELKASLQLKLSAVTKDYEALKKEHAGKFINAELELAKVKKQFELLQQEQEALKAEKQAMQQKIDEYAEELKKSMQELADLQAFLEKKNQDNVELIERVRASNKETEQISTERAELIQKVEQLAKEIEELKQAKAKKSSESSTSSTGKQSEDEFIVVREGDVNSSGPTLPPTKEELKDKIVQLENRVSELTTENGGLVLKLQDREMEKELATNVLKENLQELQSKFEEQESQLEQVQERVTDQEEQLLNLKEKAADGVVAQEQLKVLVADKLKIEAEIVKMQESLSNVVELEKRLLFAEQEKETLQVELQKLRTAHERALELETKMQKLTFENQQFKLNAEAETESLNNSAELEDKLKSLTEENETLRAELETIAQAKFRQAIAEEKQEITDLDADEEEPFNLEKLREILDIFAKQSEHTELVEATEKAYKALRERYAKIEMLEKNLTRISEEMLDMQDSKLVWEHEKKTLEADISQYILQCDELMKNNEILLNELENYKRNKLETIHENNEENILQLETQLEEYTKLNRTLEQAYAELNEKIEDQEREKQKLTEKLRATEEAKNALTSKDRDYQLQVETLELEKCNLLFELNELKSTQEKGAEVNEELKEAEAKCQNLESQLTRLSKDHADLVAAMQAQKNALMEANKKREGTEKALEEQEATVAHLNNELKELQVKRNELKTTQQATEELLKQREQELDTELNKLRERLNEKEEKLRILEEAQQTLLKQHNEEQQQNTFYADELQRVKEAKQTVESEFEELKQKYEEHVAERDYSIQLASANKDSNARVSQLEAELQATASLQQTIEALSYEKSEMLKALQQKHAENMQYYAEIQRLQQLNQQQQQQQEQIAAETKPCELCPAQMAKINDLYKEQEKLADQINFLKEKSDILTTNLLTEQTNQRLVQQEKADVLEQNATIRKDLERLREHLLEVEDMHTQETVEMQRELEETKSRMMALQTEVSKSSTAYTSASIRANQHAETLQAQYALLIQQRDELVAKLSLAEDRESKNQAALCNLQCALEQFQNDKEHDIKAATQRIRKELQHEQDNQLALQQEITALNQQLTDANQGLRAAARLSDQLEACQQTIAALREETDALRQRNTGLEKQLNTSESSQTDKIEKNLIKSLLIGYVVSSNPNDKQQVLRMISSVLDFTQNESDKVGLNKQQQHAGWLSSILGGGAATDTGAHSKDNLIQAFVQFLEQESQPQNNNMPNLLNVTQNVDATGTPSRRTSLAGNSGSSTSTAPPSVAPIPIQPLLLNSNVLNEFAPTRNSSSILKDILSDS